ncbi:hypothetical protein [Marinobacter sp. NFXS9]|uniref:hypothetical protein n=1 Tax=Marinobacter sp. NFXS9 TaxID=2818433 RepID=UPI0032DEF5FE
MRELILVEGEHVQKIQRKLIKWLSQWQIGDLSEEQVRDKAETLELRYHFEACQNDDLRSILDEALFGLGNLEIQLFTKADIPQFIDFISAKDGPQKAWERWVHYSESIDWEERRKALKGHRFYGLTE